LDKRPLPLWKTPWRQAPGEAKCGGEGDGFCGRTLGAERAFDAQVGVVQKAQFDTGLQGQRHAAEDADTIDDNIGIARGREHGVCADAAADGGVGGGRTGKQDRQEQSDPGADQDRPQPTGRGSKREHLPPPHVPRRERRQMRASQPEQRRLSGFQR
jgi:hypothetical protein